MIDQTKIAERNAQAPKLTQEEATIISEAQRISQEQMARVGATGVTHKPIGTYVAELRAGGAPDSDFVPVNVPRQFNLTLDGKERDVISFPRGVYQIPAALASHWYVKAHDVERYEGVGNVAPPREVPILSSDVFAGDKGIDPRVIDDITVAAFTLSGLSAEQWNQLTVEERGEMMSSVYGHRQHMAAKAAENSKAMAERSAAVAAAENQKSTG